MNGVRWWPPSEVRVALLGVETTPAIPVVYLTPDALMTYCEARLANLDGQIRGAFERQERNNAMSRALTEAAEVLGRFAGGIRGDRGACEEIEGAVLRAIEAVRSIDPGTALVPTLERLHADMIATGSGKDAIVSDTEMQAFLSHLKGAQGDLNAGSELTMIQLQSLMSQRQTAIQLCTSLVQSLGEQAKTIAANVGR